MRIILILLALLTASCTRTLTKEVATSVNVPVTVPCVKDVPKEIEPMRDRISKDQWAKLDTDQRQKLIVAQGLDRKAFGDKAMVVIAGCP